MIYLSEHIWDFDLPSALEEISEQRREQALKFKFEQGQRLCVLAYQLLKQGLREEYGITENPVFEYNEHGKPSIVGHPEICFNLSHCKEAAACVICDGLAHYAMNDEEVRQIEDSDNPAAAFIRLWTMKEATLKLVGTGISDDLKTAIDTSIYKYTTVERQRYIYTICEKLT